MALKFIDPDVLAILSALLAIDLAKGLDIEEQNVFGNFIICVGSIMVTIAATEEAQKVALEKVKEEEKKAKEAKEEEKKEKSAKEEEKKAKLAKEEEKKAKPEAQKTEEDDGDIHMGRAEYERLHGELQALRRQLSTLERRVAELARERK